MILQLTNSNRVAFRSACIATMCFGLLACGGGGSDSASSDAAANINPLAAMQGTYVLACFNRGPNSGESGQGTLTITAPSSGGDVDVSIRYQYYIGSTDCNTAALDTDATAVGRLTGKSNTKVYKDSAGKSVTAKVITLSYRSLTLSKGSFDGTLPMLGAMTDIAYVLDGKNLYVAKGRRGADGLSDNLSTLVAVRQ